MNTYYLGIDLNLPQDIKIIKLKRKLGYSGFGLFVELQLKLAQSKDYELSKYDYSDLAYEFRVNEKYIEDLVENFDLFEFKNDRFFIQEIKEKMQLLEAKKEAGRKAGIASGKARKDTKRTVVERSFERSLNKERKGNKEKKIKIKQKKQYGENVFLNDDEYQKLKTELGEKKLQLAIEKLNAYKLSSGKTYKSDYGAMRSWVIDKISPPEKGMNGLTKSEMENKFKNAIVI